MGEPRLCSIPPTSLLRGASRDSHLCEETWAVGWGGEKGAVEGPGPFLLFVSVATQGLGQ